MYQELQIPLMCARGNKVDHLVAHKVGIAMNGFPWPHFVCYLIFMYATPNKFLSISVQNYNISNEDMQSMHNPVLGGINNGYQIKIILKEHYEKHERIYKGLYISILSISLISLFFIFRLKKFYGIYVKDAFPFTIYTWCCVLLAIITIWKKSLLPFIENQQTIEESKLNNAFYIKVLTYVIFIFIGIWNILHYSKEIFQIKEYDIIYQPNNQYMNSYNDYSIYKSFLWINPTVFCNANRIKIPNEIANTIISTSPKFPNIKKQKNVTFYIHKTNINVLVCELQSEYGEYVKIDISECLNMADVKTVWEM